MSKTTSPHHQLVRYWRQHGRHSYGESLKTFARRQIEEASPLKIHLASLAWRANKQRRGPIFTLDPHAKGLRQLVEVRQR